MKETFKGADGVYLMLPPMWDSEDQKAQSEAYARIFVEAIRATGVKNAVYLSSYGAHRLHDAGAISGLGLGVCVRIAVLDFDTLPEKVGAVVFALRLVGRLEKLVRLRALVQEGIDSGSAPLTPRELDRIKIEGRAILAQRNAAE